MTVNATLAGNLPAGHEENGIEPILDDLTRDSSKQHLVIAVIDASYTKRKTDDGTITPTVRVRHIEVVPADERDQVYKILRATQEERIGALPLNEPEPDDPEE